MEIIEVLNACIIKQMHYFIPKENNSFERIVYYFSVIGDLDHTEGEISIV